MKHAEVRGGPGLLGKCDQGGPGEFLAGVVAQESLADEERGGAEGPALALGQMDDVAVVAEYGEQVVRRTPGRVDDLRQGGRGGGAALGEGAEEGAGLGDGGDAAHE